MKSEVVIAGGGVIGLYSAYLLALSGVKPTLIDKGDFGKQSTWAAGGILTPLLPWHYQEEITSLTANAADTYKELAESLLNETRHDIEYWPCGLTVLSPDDSSVTNWCDTHQVNYKFIDRHIYLSSVAQIRTPRLITALVKRLEQLGVTLLSNTSITKCLVEKNNIVGVETSSGTISTSNLVWATGAWIPQLNCTNENVTMPVITPIKGQIIALQNDSINLQSILYKDGYYLIPRKDGLILAGSTLEDVGYSNITTPKAKETLWAKSLEIMPALSNSEITHHWSGLRPGSPNNLPTIGPHPEITGLYLNCGHFRYGIAMAPKSCEILVDWIINQGQRLTEQEKVYSLSF